VFQSRPLTRHRQAYTPSTIPTGTLCPPYTHTPYPLWAHIYAPLSFRRHCHPSTQSHSHRTPQHATSQQHSSIHPRTSCSHTPAHNLTAAQLTADVQRLSPLPANPTHLSLPHPPATVLPHPAVPAHRPPPSCQRSCVTFGVRVSRLRFWG
jgi:hypothetical protein